jgi:hypothetical protein
MRPLFWRRARAGRHPADRDTALRALQSLRHDRLLRPVSTPTPGSVNDDYWAIQAGLGGFGLP